MASRRLPLKRAVRWIAGVPTAVLLLAALHPRGIARTEPRARAQASVAPLLMLDELQLSSDFPRQRGELELDAEGRMYFPSGGAYYVYDAAGRFLERRPSAGKAMGLVPLADGTFVAARAGKSGRLVRLRADGTERVALVKQGRGLGELHPDKTGWTNPSRLAVDTKRDWILVFDATQAANGVGNDFARVAAFGPKGNFVRDLVSPAQAGTSTYDDLEVDAERERVFVTERETQTLRVYDYRSNLVASRPGVSGVAVWADGRVAVGNPDRRHIDIYDAALKWRKSLELTDSRDLEVDASGALLATSADPALLVTRWRTDSGAPTGLWAPHRRLRIEQPPPLAKPGGRVSLHFETSIFPLETPTPKPRVRARAVAEGASRFRELASTSAGGALSFVFPADWVGPVDLVIDLPAASEDGPRATLHTTLRAEATRPKLAIRSRLARTAFVQGEAVKLRVLGASLDQPLELVVARRGGAGSTAAVRGGYVELPAEVTRRLLPGRYVASLENADADVVPFEFDIVNADADSPMQRILYHEFDRSPATTSQSKLPDRSARLEYIGAYLAQLKRLGFTRETDRAGERLLDGARGKLQSVSSSVEQAFPGYFVPSGGNWEADVYLDRATALGLRYDTQLLPHCATVPLADERVDGLANDVGKLGRWLGKYPSFYGFNVNDELFFDNMPFTSMPANDRAWLDDFLKAHPGAERADAYRIALERLYSGVSAATRLASPHLSTTATPMWQFPAVDGSYAPSIYRQLGESYSHYLSEGYDWSFSAPHAAEMLRRPGLPLMAVFDNGFKTLEGDGYLKNALLVLGRGVQGIGVSHTRPFDDAAAASALTLANDVAKIWGPVFATATPDNEGSILYSYAQDTIERRRVLGTPHWERVFALYGAALLAGVPSNVVYEEDVAAGALLKAGKPRVPVLFLVGQQVELPEPVRAAIAAFRAAGGRVVIDQHSTEISGAKRLTLPLDEVTARARETLDSDALFPAAQPAYLAAAAMLRSELGAQRRFPVDSSDPWIPSNRFSSGEVEYVLAATETGPFTVTPGEIWALGASYNRSYQPRQATLSVPAAGAVYDVLEQQRLMGATRSESAMQLSVDLRTFPGRLFALLPRALPPPRLELSLSTIEVKFRIGVGVEGGVPLRVRLLQGEQLVSERFELSSVRGVLEGTFARPSEGGHYRIEAQELLSGQAARAEWQNVATNLPIAVPSEPVELDARDTIVALLRERRPLRLALPDAKYRTFPAVKKLQAELERRGPLQITDASPLPIISGLTVAFAVGPSPKGLLIAARQQRAVSLAAYDDEPRPGRASVTPLLGLRARGEDVVLVALGDEEMLPTTIESLLAAIGAPQRAVGRGGGATVTRVVGSPATLPTWRLSEHVGAHLVDVKAAGSRVAVAARGFLGNVALVRDDGAHADVVAASRVGEGPQTTSLFVSQDGLAWGAAARTTQRFGEALWLQSSGGADAFAAFGDAGGVSHRFAVSPDARTVVVPGTNGVVAWRRGAGGWQESWSEPYYRGFDALSWPVANDTEREAWFEVTIPDRSAVALIGFGELNDNGWIRGQATAKVAVSARALEDGKLLWRYEPRLSGQLAFPTIYASADGRQVLLQVRLGSWRQQSYELHLLSNGKLVARWTSPERPLAVAFGGERLGVLSTHRSLTIRDGQGRLLDEQTTPAQGMSVAISDSGTVTYSDDAGLVRGLSSDGAEKWDRELGSTTALTWGNDAFYAAGWDGRLRKLTESGELVFSVDVTPALRDARSGAARIHGVTRPAQTSAQAPPGANLLAHGKAKLAIGGTPGWKSTGALQVQADMLTNHRVDDCTTPWLSDAEEFWSATTGRQVWVEISFPTPTDVSSLTVYEDPRFANSFPTEGHVENWDEETQAYRTVKHAVFLSGAVNTYELGLKRVTKLRYVPWSSYFRNFHTSEIEVR